MTPTATRTQLAPAADVKKVTALVVPGEPEGARRTWRRLITRIDPTKTGAYALLGHGLAAGHAYQLPLGALVIACDIYTDRREVRLLRADTADLAEVKAWTLKAPLGKRVVDYVARRLPEGARLHAAYALEALPNRWDGWCARCRQPVPARTGRVEYSRVAHHPGQCPPPPQLIDPNSYPGLCFACGGWVVAGRGVAIRLDTPDEATGARYRPMHNTPCPPDAPPGPPNRVTGWCADCGELVTPGEGYWYMAPQ